jgi:hypothetical protein
MFQKRNQCRRSRHRFAQASIESLEARELLASVTVNASQVVKAVSTPVLGVNLMATDPYLLSTTTQQLIQSAGLTMFRFPGGSMSDQVHFNVNWASGAVASMASFIASVNGQATVTLDYGSGSPQEAAAFLSYLNAPVGATTQIGNGQEWNTTTNSWQTVNWQNAGYWSGVRAATPITPDDGLNFLRIGRSAPFGFHYYEVGCEEYGNWETDHHTPAHDPATYVAFAKQFQTFAASIDPSISIGIDAFGTTITVFTNWLAAALQQAATQGLTVGFLSDHAYDQTDGTENDQTLLLHTVSDPSSEFDWSTRAAGYENLLTKYLGSTAAANVALLNTETNSAAGNIGKQTSSLVNGLWLADSMGSMLESPFIGEEFYCLTSGGNPNGNNSSSLYGWREVGTLALFGINGSPPVTGLYTPFPTYFAEQLVSKVAEAGGAVVQASSSDANLAVYAVHETNGRLELLVINKSPSGAISGQFQISNYQPSAQAQLWQYGEAEDTAQSKTSDGHASLSNYAVTLSLSGANFSYSFPAYSMSVFDLSPGGPTITTPASATPNPVTGKTTKLSVGASDPAGASSLTYTWSTTGSSPSGVTYSANGNNAAQTTTATFTQKGTYYFTVTVADPSGFTASSSVTVQVNQTLTSIKVTPNPVTLYVQAHQQFTANALDQFGKPMASQPVVKWTVASGGGVINQYGYYSAPSTPGTAVVTAASGLIAGSAKITIIARTNASALKASATAVVTPSGTPGTGALGTVTITNTSSVPTHDWSVQRGSKRKITGVLVAYDTDWQLSSLGQRPIRYHGTRVATLLRRDQIVGRTFYT